MSNVISATIQHSLNKTLLETNNSASAGPSTVVLIISPSDRPSTADIERARELMNSLRTTYFDVYFAYTAQDLTEFQNINNEYLDYSELFLTVRNLKIYFLNVPREVFIVNPIRGILASEAEKKLKTS